MLSRMLDQRPFDERGPVGRLAPLDSAVDELELLLVQSEYDGVLCHISDVPLHFRRPPTIGLTGQMGVRSRRDYRDLTHAAKFTSHEEN
jgi:hypothetical protein